MTLDLMKLKKQLKLPKVLFPLLALLAWIILAIPVEKAETRILILAFGGLWIFWRVPQWKTLLLILIVGGATVLPCFRQSETFLPADGEYRIMQIRSGYAIAQNEDGSVIVYEPEKLWIEQKVRVSGFEKLHTLNNPEIFSFQQSMEEKGIEYCGQNLEPIETAPATIKGKIFRWISNLPCSDLFQMLFYGITSDENLAWMSSLGLGMIALIQALRKILTHFFVRKTAGWIIVGIECGLLFLFPVTPSLVRLLVFTLAGQISKDWTIRWPLSVFLFLTWMPSQAAKMAFVLPAGISFLSHFAQSSASKKAVSMGWCALCQIFYMKKVSLLFLGFFTAIRTVLGWFFLLALPGMFFESWGSFFENLAAKITINTDWLTIHGMAPFWYSALLIAGFLWLLWKDSKLRTAGFCFLFCLYPWVWKLDPFFHVYQLDVGQGDAAVIVEPFGKSVVMIDAAGRFNHDNASELFIPFFQAKQIDHVDDLIVTHSDFDHNGSVESLCKQFSVRNVIISGTQKPSVSYSMEFLLPERPSSLEEGHDEEDQNDLSLICTFSYDGFRFLFTGDASQKVEAELTDRYNLESDILKLGHHGSKTSSDEDFLKAVNPQLALISSGYQNRYGHPNTEVLEKLNLLGIDRINTADHGQIHLFSLGRMMWIRTGSGLTAYIKPSEQLLLSS